MKYTHLGRHLATFGLIAVLLVLTVCSIGATVFIWQASTRASEAVHMNDLYQQANYFANAEDAVLDQYALRSGPHSRAEFRATAQKLLAVLQTVGRDGDADDRAFVQSMLEKQTHYLWLADQFLALV